MGDPERLLSAASDADEFERALLQSVRGAGPTKAIQDQAWQGIAAQLGAAALAGAAVSGAATGAAGAAATAKVGAEATVVAGTLSLAPKAAVGLKLAVALAVTSAAVGGGAVWLDQHDRHAAAPAPARAQVAVHTTRLATAEEGALQVGSEPAALEEVRASAQEPRTTKSRASDPLLHESRALALARTQLHAGDTSAARATLERLGAQSPRGVLGQEREVLLIEVLAAQGHHALVARKVKAFISAHPESPHSPRLARFLSAP
ncbi:MAG: hypothetical protein QM778_38585 [Myxococcales bacterium]